MKQKTLMRWRMKIVLIVVSVCLLAASAFSVWVEGPGRGGSGKRFQRLAGIENTAGVAAWSLRSQYSLLFECDAALRGNQSLEMMYAGDEVRQRTVAVCAELADNLTATMPTFSYAWYIGAFSSAILGQWDKMNEQLLQSSNSGPFEQWIAEVRVAVSEDYFSNLQPTTIAAHERDLELLVVSRRGVASIARRYVAREEFRERITALVERMPVNFQARFLLNVKQVYGFYGTPAQTSATPQ